METEMEVQMGEKQGEKEPQPPKNYCSKRIKQKVSVPFLWEEKPGIPKRDWKPSAPSTNLPPASPPPPPIKLIATVPFQWEEKPGKPLACFSQAPLESVIMLPKAKTIKFPSYQDDDDFESDGPMLELWLEGSSSETDSSFSSAPSLLGNCLVSTVAISSAVPVQQTSPWQSNGSKLQTPPSPASESDDSTSSYATGTTSLVGGPFLECLFPLLSPHLSFLDKKVGCPEKCSSPVPVSKDSDHETKDSLAIRRPLTLGELILMSRRISYRRKAVQMPKQNLSMEFMKRKACGCGIFGGSNRITQLQRKWKRRLQLKLMYP